MSNVIYPSLPGLNYGVSQTPTFSTKVQTAVSGMEARSSFMAYPTWKFSLNYEFLRTGASAEFQKMLGFFLARKGMFDSFLFDNPDDNSVTDQNFGTGDGATTTFQLKRTFGSTYTFTEPVQNVNAIVDIKKNGTTQTTPANYSIDANGLVTFATPPANGNALTWSGSYYYRVRFLQDAAEFNKFMQALFELKRIEFIGSPMNKV